MKSDIAALLPVVDELMLLIRKSRCVPVGERDVECALREALDNAVVHGNREDPDKQVHISCRCEPGKELSVVIRHGGSGFDSTKAVSQAITKDAQSGIPLMRLLMDEVHFEQGGRETHMLKTRDSEEIELILLPDVLKDSWPRPQTAARSQGRLGRVSIP